MNELDLLQQIHNCLCAIIENQQVIIYELKNGTSKRHPKYLTLSEVLDEGPMMKDLIGGCIVSQCQKAKCVSCANYDSLREEFLKKNWGIPKKKEDFPDKDRKYDEMNTYVNVAIIKALARKISPEYVNSVEQHIRELYAYADSHFKTKPEIKNAQLLKLTTDYLDREVKHLKEQGIISKI